MIYIVLYVYLYNMIYIEKQPSHECTNRRIYNMQHTMRIKTTAMDGRKNGLVFQNNGYCSSRRFGKT